MFQKVFFISTAAFLLGSVAQAGQIQVGQVVSGVNLGLTGSGSTLNTGGVITTTRDNLNNYNPTLFQGAQYNSSTPSEPVATSTETSSLQVVDPTNGGGVTFDMLGGNSAGTQNTWYSTSTASTSSITVPINLQDVDTVWTMLNDLGTSNTVVSFYFNTTDSTTGATIVNVALTDGVDIRSAVLCSTGCPSSYSTTITNASHNDSYSETGAASGSGVIQVSTGSVQYPIGTAFSPAYNSTTSGWPAFGTTGSLTMDDQAFQLSSLSFDYSDYLVQVVVSQAGGLSGNGHFDLTALTLDQPSAGTGPQSLGSAPEPSTMALGGLGMLFTAVSFLRKRRTT